MNHRLEGLGWKNNITSTLKFFECVHNRIHDSEKMEVKAKINHLTHSVAFHLVPLDCPECRTNDSENAKLNDPLVYYR